MKCIESICSEWYNGSYTMEGEAMKNIELHYLIIQF